MREETAMSSSTHHARQASLVGLLVIQLVVGYEWLDSGVTKVVRGGFPSGLASDLHERVQSAAGWYRNFIDGSIIPHAVTFGYLIEIAELTVGVVLIVTAALWLWRWDELSERTRRGVLVSIVGASLAGIFMAVNFHLANGGTHPWLIPKSGFDESIDLDTLLPVIQLVFIGVSVAAWRAERHLAHAASGVMAGRPSQGSLS
jgi:thiosulfate dehydrogenase [quinone] large subunit